MAPQRPYELIFSLVAIGGLTAGYLFLARAGIPRPSSPVGYVLGITGLLLMVCTQTLYSLRKRLPRFTVGRMSLWLQAHIVTGLVGPFLVLLHSGWKFNGLAGVLTLLTGVVVFSGLVGRFVYTAVPRGLEGAELLQPRQEQGQVLVQDRRVQTEVRWLEATRRLLALWQLFHIPLSAVVLTLAFIHVVAVLYYATLLK